MYDGTMNGWGHNVSCFRTMVALTLDDVSCLATMMYDGCMYLASWLHVPCIVIGACTLHCNASPVKLTR